MIYKSKHAIILLCITGFSYTAPLNFVSMRDRFVRAVATMQNESLVGDERQNACLEAQNVIQQLRETQKNSYALHLFFGFGFNGFCTTDDALDNQKLNTRLDQIKDELLKYQRLSIASTRTLGSEQVQELEKQVRTLQQLLTAVRSELVATRRYSDETCFSLTSLRRRYDLLVAQNRALLTANRDLRGCLEEVGQQLRELEG